MKKLKLTLAEIESLYNEIEDALKQKIPFTVKFDLRELLNNITPKVENLKTSRNEIITKFGILDEKKQFYTLIGSDKYQEGIEEMHKLINKKQEIRVKELDKKEFKDNKSEFAYNVIFKLLKE